MKVTPTINLKPKTYEEVKPIADHCRVELKKITDDARIGVEIRRRAGNYLNQALDEVSDRESWKEPGYGVVAMGTVMQVMHSMAQARSMLDTGHPLLACHALFLGAFTIYADMRGEAEQALTDANMGFPLFDKFTGTGSLPSQS